jgi:preprotein translocase subunit SecD
VVHSTPDILIELASPPKAVKEGEDVVGILLKLQPPQAAALERVSRDRLGHQIAIVMDGEVVTMHKIREVIKNGDVKITSCAAGAAGYLLKQLEAHQLKQ